MAVTQKHKLMAIKMSLLINEWHGKLFPFDTFIFLLLFYHGIYFCSHF